MWKIASTALISLTLAACVQTPSAPDPDVTARATELALRYTTIDTHIDVPYRLYANNDEDISRATDGGDFDYPRARAGGLDALFMSIYIPAEVDEQGEARRFANDLIDGVQNLAENDPGKFTLATCTTDILDAKARGLIAMPLGMENGGPLKGDLENLQYFHERGIRYITLAHSKSNHISDSSYDDNEQWEGLSPFGKRLIPAMNEQGVMVDVSHISDDAFWQVIELTAVPVIASHSSLRHFTPGFRRNMSDDMVEALGRNGGVIQINYGTGFLTAEARDYATAQAAAFDALRTQQPDLSDAEIADFAKRYRAENPYPYATVDDVLDHIDRAVRLAGIDHVGIGSDYDGVGDSLPVGLKDVSSYPTLVAGLLARGYEDAEVEKILGGNLLRVWQAVETYAAQAGQPPLCRL